MAQLQGAGKDGIQQVQKAILGGLGGRGNGLETGLACSSRSSAVTKSLQRVGAHKACTIDKNFGTAKLPLKELQVNVPTQCFVIKRSSTCGYVCRLLHSNYNKPSKFAAASFSAFRQLVRQMTQLEVPNCRPPP